MMNNQEHRVDRHGLPVDNTRDLGRVVCIDENVVGMQIVVPEDPLIEVIVFGQDVRVQFEKVV